MQHNKAQKLQEEWGNKFCNHPNFEKEYYLGSDTTDFICSVCGAAFTKQEQQDIEESRNEQAS